jgi:secreted trypsin-like serine protease
VLTAAHCLDLDQTSVVFNPEFSTLESIMRVYFGFVDKSQIFKPNVIQNYERRVIKITRHPNYNPFTLQNDLAVLELDKPIRRDVDVNYVCLFDYDKNDQLVGSQPLYTAGWGSITPNHLSLIYPDALQYIDVNVYPMTNCVYIYPEPEFSYLFNSSTHVCAGHPESIGKDTCYADSGSPLLVQLKGQWFVYGVVTFGSAPDCAKGPSMFMRIAYYADWLRSVTLI